jgi:hypothetical protein
VILPKLEIRCRYVEQLVASAQAAVDEVVKRGVCLSFLITNMQLRLLLSVTFEEYSLRSLVEMTIAHERTRI